MSAPSSVAAILAVAMAMAALATAQQCGSQAGGETCPNCLCCSTYGYCGSDPAYCGAGCQSQCSGCSSGPGSGVASIVSRDLFERFLLHQNNAACLARGFYTYDAFLAAAAAYPAFGTTGDLDTRKPEVAAFFGQTSHETTGGWPTAPDGTYSWGYCFKQEQGSPGSPPADLLRLQARMAMRARQAVLRPRPHPAHPQLQLRTGRARNWSGPTEQPGPGGDRPDSVVQDGDLVLDDDAVGQAIVPRRDHGTVDSNG